MPTFTEEYRTTDKSEWGPGPWQDEPDKAVWVDPATGLDCMIHRNHAGAWCGYVGVPEGHPAHGKDYDEVQASVHGGLTYAGACQPVESPETGLCHIEQPGRPDHVWWVGFDCGHYMDFMPALEVTMREIRRKYHDSPGYTEVGGTYRDINYVVLEVQDLAKQLAEQKS